MLILQRMNSLNIHVNHHPLLWQKLRIEYKNIIYVQNEACSWKDLNLHWKSPMNFKSIAQLQLYSHACIIGKLPSKIQNFEDFLQSLMKNIYP